MGKGWVRNMVEFSIEPVSVLLANDGLKDMTRQHWEEVEEGPFNPDWEAVEREEKNGIGRWFCARIDKELVGYARVKLVRSETNKGNVHAVINDLFVKPIARGTRAAIGLLRYVIETLRKIGVASIMIDAPLKKGRSVDALYKRLGFEPMSMIWEMRT